MAAKEKLLLVRDKLSLQQGMTMKQKEQLTLLQVSLKEAQLNYFRHSTILRMLRTIARSKDNETLSHHMSSLEAFYYTKDIVLYDKCHWETLMSNDSLTPVYKRAVINNLMEIISQECLQIIQWLDKGSSKSLSEIQLEKLSLLVKEKRDGITLKEHTITKLKQDIHINKLEHYKILNDCCSILCKLIKDYQVEYLAKQKEFTVNHLISKTQALDHKLKVIQLELKVATYTQDKNIALKEIRSYLLSAQQQLELQLISNRSTLEQYKSLGRDFMSLADNYHYIRNEIDNKKWSLQELGGNNIITTSPHL